MSPKLLIDPMVIFTVLTVAALFTVIKRKSIAGSRIEGLFYVTIGFLIWIVILALPITFNILSSPLYVENDTTINPEYIVVLSNSFNRAANPDDDILTSSTMYRVAAGVKLYHKHPSATMVMSGGCINDPSRPSDKTVRLMKQFAVQQGVPPEKIMLEGNSSNTFQHALETAKLLPDDVVLVIVTEPYHLYRAVRTFRFYFTNVSGYAGIGMNKFQFRWDFMMFVPRTSIFTSSLSLLHEYVGIVWYEFRRTFGE